MDLSATAADTLRILAEGAYVAPSGARVALAARVDHAVAGTVLYRPEDFDRPPLTLAGSESSMSARVSSPWLRISSRRAPP